MVERGGRAEHCQRCTSVGFTRDQQSHHISPYSVTLNCFVKLQDTPRVELQFTYKDLRDFFIQLLAMVLVKCDMLKVDLCWNDYKKSRTAATANVQLVR